ncbi:hypothetical protein [Peribacillus frigoritolerans]|uniref:hypothetical protein n=1 Tax=Peribacillus frigoritolerans TaxID=450367 RepID=UPI002162AAC0|nr:hypothetical protein [Peribacillus frigoritolerans]
MARKTKALLEKELQLLQNENDNLREKIFNICFDREYWYIQAENFKANLHKYEYMGKHFDGDKVIKEMEERKEELNRLTHQVKKDKLKSGLFETLLDSL